jgi:hypothetical protein
VARPRTRSLGRGVIIDQVLCTDGPAGVHKFASSGVIAEPYAACPIRIGRCRYCGCAGSKAIYSAAFSDRADGPWVAGS